MKYIYISILLMLVGVSNIYGQKLVVESKSNSKMVSKEMINGEATACVIVQSALKLSFSTNMGNIPSSDFSSKMENGLYVSTIYFHPTDFDNRRTLIISCNGYVPERILLTLTAKQKYMYGVYDAASISSSQMSSSLGSADKKTLSNYQVEPALSFSEKISEALRGIDSTHATPIANQTSSNDSATQVKPAQISINKKSPYRYAFALIAGVNTSLITQSNSKTFHYGLSVGARNELFLPNKKQIQKLYISMSSDVLFALQRGDLSYTYCGKENKVSDRIYLNTPILVNLYPGIRTFLRDVRFSVGVQPDFLLFANCINDDVSSLNKNDLGLRTFGISVPVSIGYYVARDVFLDIGYCVGVTNMLHGKSDKLRNHTLNISTHIRF